MIRPAFTSSSSARSFPRPCRAGATAAGRAALRREAARRAALAAALLLAATLATTLAAVPATAGVRALLVGVSAYHHLDADLNGPRNDVVLMARTLMARGAQPGDIRILTTPGTALEPGLAPAEDPTRAAILSGLDRLAAEAGPQDTVVFYYSGHGSQAPDLSGDEGGGHDEILLPSDAAGWQGALGMVENAILDDELQVKMQAILDTGAQVVAILDACHSATGFRDLGGRGVARYVPPAALGIPEDAAGVVDGAPAPPLSGDFVFLYSSQSDERSFEYPLGDPRDPGNWYGDFTRNLGAVLTSVPDLSWAQALAAAADGLRREQASQTPDGEGPALVSPVFGAAPVPGRMRVEAGILTEGLLSGLSEGAEVELFDAAAGGASLGRARLREVEATRSRLEAAAPPDPLLPGAPQPDAPQSGALPSGSPQPDPPQSGAPPSGSPQPDALPALAYAELRSPGLPPPLRLAPLAVADAGDYRAAQALLAEIAAQDLLDGVRWDAADYDLRLVATGGALALVGRDGVLDGAGPGSSPRIPAQAGRDELLGFLERAARLERLRTALAATGGGRRFAAGAGLAVEGEVLAAAPPAAAASASGHAAGPAPDPAPDPAISPGIVPEISLTGGPAAGAATEATTEAVTDPATDTAFDPATAPAAAPALAAGCGEATGPARPLADGTRVADCDQVWLTLANGGRRAQDVTVLFVGRDLRITPIWPLGDLSNRIAFGERAEVGLELRSDGLAFGIEEILVIAVPARDGAPRTVLTGLADGSVSRGAGAASETAAWLLAAADPQAQARGFRPPGTGGAGTEPVRVTRIRVSHAPQPGAAAE